MPELLGRQHGYSWEAIAQRLAVSVPAARRRFGAYSSWRNRQQAE